jgi:hypothetical protein
MLPVAATGAMVKGPLCATSGPRVNIPPVTTAPRTVSEMGWSTTCWVRPVQMLAGKVHWVAVV